jgi:gliding motility-associated-like protein
LATINQTLYQLPKDTIIAPSGNLICVGKYQPMLITSFAKSYQWYLNDSIIPGANSVNYNAYLQGVYSAKVTDSLNCSNKTVNSIKMVDLNNFKILFNTDSINCVNVSKQFLNNSDTSNIRNISWFWKFNGEDSSSDYNAFTKFTKPGLKKISLNATVPSCIYSINRDTLISIAAPLAPKNLQTQSTSANRPIQLQARTLEGAQYKYSWQPVWGLDFLTVKDPVFTYYKSQKYFISMTSPDGCITVDTIKVNVFDSVLVDVFVPKSFTPNGDGVNDILYPYIAGLRSLSYFKIINKWGKTVFESRNIAEGWNGTSGGNPQPMDAYSWLAEGIDLNGNPISRTGNVLLIR